MSPNSKPPSTLPGLWKYPSKRDTLIRSDTSWLEGRREDDGAEGLWRIHDTLYDFSDFIDRHPGGAEWLNVTKGTDITEAFEAHHISPMPAKMLTKFAIRPSISLRNSPYTFNDDGFYATLRKRVYALLPESSMRGPSVPSRLIVDCLVLSMLSTAVCAAIWQLPSVAVLAGILLGMATSAAHNFLHLKYNWRRYYFHFSLLSAKHWGVIHVLSHHLYPNSLHDLEIAMVEPWFHYLPREDKNWTRYISWIIAPIVYASVFILEYVRYILEHGPTVPDMIPLLVPTLMVVVNQAALIAPPDPANTIILWFYMIITGSFWFTGTGLNTGHHHPDTFHDGDAPREDRDWGMAQLDSVRDRPSVSGVRSINSENSNGEILVRIDCCTTWIKFFLVLTNFGHHTLHHLFPTVDHYRLSLIYPILEETLNDFGIPFETASAFNCIKGQFSQLVKNEPNTNPPDAKFKPKSCYVEKKGVIKI